jgi:hypothetical protein
MDYHDAACETDNRHACGECNTQITKRLLGYPETFCYRMQHLAHRIVSPRRCKSELGATRKRYGHIAQNNPRWQHDMCLILSRPACLYRKMVSYGWLVTSPFDLRFGCWVDPGERNRRQG